MPPPDTRLHNAAAERNRDPILGVLKDILPAAGRLLEISSGTGQHVAHFAQALPQWHCQPSDLDERLFDSIRAWVAEAGVDNVAPPRRLDAASEHWPVDDSVFDAIYCANMIHIAPWAACLGLMAGAARHLVPGGLLVLYGPYRLDGQHTAPSNAAFDESLRSRDPAWGVRDLETVIEAATAVGLQWRQRVEMPANNQLLVFARTPA